MLLRDAAGVFVRPTARTAPLFQEPGPGVGVPGRAEERQMKLSDIAKERRGQRIMDAVVSRYGTPERVLARLGIDQSLLEEPMTAEQVLKTLQDSLSSLDEGEMQSLYDGLVSIVNSFDPENPGASDARRRRLASDARLTPQDRARQSFARRFPGAMRIDTGAW
jgi:hypothetical protein